MSSLLSNSYKFIQTLKDEQTRKFAKANFSDFLTDDEILKNYGRVWALYNLQRPENEPILELMPLDIRMEFSATHALSIEADNYSSVIFIDMFTHFYYAINYDESGHKL